MHTRRAHNLRDATVFELSRRVWCRERIGWCQQYDKLTPRNRCNKIPEVLNNSNECASEMQSAKQASEGERERARREPKTEPKRKRDATSCVTQKETCPQNQNIV